MACALLQKNSEGDVENNVSKSRGNLEEDYEEEEDEVNRGPDDQWGNNGKQNYRNMAADDTSFKSDVFTERGKPNRKAQYEGGEDEGTEEESNKV